MGVFDVRTHENTCRIVSLVVVISFGGPSVSQQDGNNDGSEYDVGNGFRGF